MLPHNISQGVIISNHSLVLQGVSRATAGNYSCVGYNAEGDGMSPPFELNVLCKYFDGQQLFISRQPTRHPERYICALCCVMCTIYVAWLKCAIYPYLQATNHIKRRTNLDASAL